MTVVTSLQLRISDCWPASQGGRKDRPSGSLFHRRDACQCSTPANAATSSPLRRNYEDAPIRSGRAAQTFFTRRSVSWYNRRIHESCKRQDWEAAEQLTIQMRREGFHPDACTYRLASRRWVSYDQSIGGRRLMPAVEIPAVEYALQYGTKPEVETCNAISGSVLRLHDSSLVGKDVANRTHYCKGKSKSHLCHQVVASTLVSPVTFTIAWLLVTLSSRPSPLLPCSPLPLTPQHTHCSVFQAGPHRCRHGVGGSTHRRARDWV